MMVIPTKEDYDRLDQKLNEILKVIGRNTPPTPQKRNEGGIDFALSILSEKADLNSKPTVYKWSHEGRIPCEKRGKRLWFHRNQLETWIESGMPHYGKQQAAKRMSDLNR